MPTPDEDQLTELQKEQARLVRRTSRLAAKFVDATGRWAADWIGEHIRESVEGQPKHTLAIHYKLGEMKAETAEVQAATPARTRTALADLPWTFRETPEQRARGTPTQSLRDESPLALHSSSLPPDAVVRRLRPVLGEAGRILDLFGYRDVTSEWDDWKTERGDFRYPYEFALSEETYGALNATATSDTAVLRLGQQIGALKRRIDEAQAGAAWDAARRR